MTIPVPFPIQPGDRLTIVRDNPNGTDLKTGDLVTAIETSIHVTDGRPVPVVQVSTPFGPQLLTFNAVQPAAALRTYTPAERDDVVDQFFFNMIGADNELLHWTIRAKSDLEANDPKPGQEPKSGTVTGTPSVGEPYVFTDNDGDTLEVHYYEGHTGNGREGIFHININEEQVVVLPASDVNGLLSFLYNMRRHSERTDDES